MSSNLDDALVFEGRPGLAIAAGLVGLAVGTYVGQQLLPFDGTLLVGAVVGLSVCVVAIFGLL